MEITLNNQESLKEAALEFISKTASRHVYAFHGEMGTGKTTFISAVCKELGITDDTGSPTFSIINEYFAPSTGETIYHFDCYRLESREEAFDIGMEDYLYSGSKCFIEWPDIIDFILPEDTLHVYMTSDPVTGKRTIKFDI